MGKTTMATGPRNPCAPKKPGVQSLYTEKQVSEHICAKKNAGMSLRAIAAEYGLRITHADIKRALQDKFPHDLGKRHALGLAPICEHCGQKVHQVKVEKVRLARIVPGWVNQAVRNLKELEQKNEIRIYSRSGKRVSA